ncbi:MCP methyltransferase, CheR-type [Beggiatoa sp. PS]|nr:MCP methyltransferase, CheR-type [Beggiatoa sp. PS]
MDQIHGLVDVLVPQYFSTTRTEPLRIWSAACSSGEEPLSIAIALNEAGWFDKVPIEIMASDISLQTIRKAQQGIYRHYAMRNLPENLRTKYFQREQDTWRISPTLLSRIKWKTANLTTKNEIAQLAFAHVIFCRNVFIYFSDHKIRQTVQTFFDFMPQQAYLFVGSSESLLKITTDFELQEIGGAFVYVKRQ